MRVRSQPQSAKLNTYTQLHSFCTDLQYEPAMPVMYLHCMAQHPTTITQGTVVQCRGYFDMSVTKQQYSQPVMQLFHTGTVASCWATTAPPSQ